MSRRRVDPRQMLLPFGETLLGCPPIAAGMAARDIAQTILAWQGSARLPARDYAFLSVIANARILTPEQGRRLAKLIARMRGLPQ